MTTEDLADPHFGLALVDRVVPGRFALKKPYGWHIETPFQRRSAAARETVLAAMLLILPGAEIDDALGVSGKELAQTAAFRPFVKFCASSARTTIISGSMCAHGRANRLHDGRTQVMKVLRAARLCMLIIDEIHHIIAGYITKQRVFLNVLKYLANELQIPLVGVGTADAVRALQTDPQLAEPL